MRSFLIFIFILSLMSCETFNVKKTSSEAILKEELQTFNWHDVDKYPSVSICDTLISEKEKIACFQYTINTRISQFLHKNPIVVSQDINDTLVLQFQVSKQGKLKLIKSIIDSITIQEIPNIKDIINQSLDSFPKIYPAVKRGQHVTSTFDLPLIINMN